MDVRVADDIDRGIIDALRADGRRPFRRIAADLGVSESTVRARYSRLASLGIVQVVGLPDLHSVGTVEGHITVQVSGGSSRTLAQHLARRPEVKLIAAAVGAADLVLDVVFANASDFRRFVSVELPALPGVHRIEFFRTREVVKDSYVWSD